MPNPHQREVDGVGVACAGVEPDPEPDDPGDMMCGCSATDHRPGGGRGIAFAALLALVVAAGRRRWRA